MTTLRNQAPAGAHADARIRLRDASWSVRISRASRGRCALEVYVGESLVDVVVPTALVPGALRGACSAVTDDRHPVSLAWGVFAADREEPPGVRFGRRRGAGRRMYRVGETFTIGDGFWISAVDGRFPEVAVARADGAVEHRTVPARRDGTARESGVEHDLTDVTDV